MSVVLTLMAVLLDAVQFSRDSSVLVSFWLVTGHLHLTNICSFASWKGLRQTRYFIILSK